MELDAFEFRNSNCEENRREIKNNCVQPLQNRNMKEEIWMMVDMVCIQVYI